jgi:3-hydroxybutyryl-CoA dehydrogenase
MIRNVAVIGAGVAGRAFALRCAQAGFAVVLEDVMPAKLRRAQDEFGELGACARYALTVEEAVADADIAVDFVPDELESKLEIFSMLDRMAPPRTILLTPTNALSITDLASCTYRAERCVGLRVSGADILAGETLVLLRSRFASGSAIDDTAAFLAKLQLRTNIEDDTEEPQLVKNLSL